MIKEYVITHGNVKQDGKYIAQGGFVSLEEKEADALNLKGETLRLKSTWDIEQKGEAAKAAEIAKHSKGAK